MIEATNRLLDKEGMNDKDKDTVRKVSSICGIAERLVFTFDENPELREELKAIHRHDLSSRESFLLEMLDNVLVAAENLNECYDISAISNAAKKYPPTMENFFGSTQ